MSENKDKRSVFPPLDHQPEYYGNWKLRIRMLLQRKNCLEPIEAPRPSTGNDLEAKQKEYDEKNRKAVGYISDHLTDFALAKIKDKLTSAYEVWTGLAETYENKSISNQLNVLTRLLNFKMKNDTKIEMHFGALDALVSELQLAGAQSAEDTALLTAVLLASMPAAYSQAVTAIAMASGPVPSYESVRQRLRDFSLSLDLKSTNATTANVMVADGDAKKKKKKKKKNGGGTSGQQQQQQQQFEQPYGFRGRLQIARMRGRVAVARGRMFRGGRVRYQPYPLQDHWTRNNQCSFCKGFGHQYQVCLHRQKKIPQANLVTVQPQQQPTYDQFGYIVPGHETR